MEVEKCSFNAVAREIFESNEKKGFWSDSDRSIFDVGDVSTRLMLIVSELGESMEALREQNFADIEYYKSRKSEIIKSLNTSLLKDEELEQKKAQIANELFKDNIKDTFEDEIADTIIRLFDFCGGMEIDLNFHINKKLKYNATRAKLHGKSF